MPATLSAENRITQALQAFQCSQRAFVDLAKNLGVPVAAGPFSEALNGKRNLEIAVIEKLFSVLERMDGLAKSVSPVPVDWGRTEQVATALTLRMLAQVDQEQQFVELADQATRAISHVS